MLPSLFISHGSPMLALEPGASGPALTRLAAELYRNHVCTLGKRGTDCQQRRGT